MPTIKQEKVFNKIVENRGNISKTMREVGYSEKTAKNPKNLTESKGWQELLNTIKDEPLLNRLNEIALNKKGARDSIEAIKEIHRLKDRYPKETTELETGEVKVIIKKSA